MFEEKNFCFFLAALFVKGFLVESFGDKKSSENTTKATKTPDL